MRYYTPEPSFSVVSSPSTHVVDRRRYSTAGNLDIYRPHVDKSLSSSPIIYWRSPAYDTTVAKTIVSDNGIGKSAYYSNGPRWPYYSTLPSTYLTSSERQYYPGRRTNETQYDVDKFENLLKRTFGSGTGSRSYGYPYSSYYSPYYSTLPRYSSSYYYDRPYYSDSYSYPYYYSHPYYSSYYSPSPYYNRGYYGTTDLGYYGSPYYPSRYSYSYTV